MTGIVDYQRDTKTIFNTLIVVGNKEQNDEHGHYRYLDSNRYQKHQLLPIGEFVPFEDILRPIAPLFDLPMSSFSRGDKVQNNLRANGFNLLPAICYEIVFADLVRGNYATIASVWIFTFVNLLGGSWVSRLCTLGLVLILIPVVGTATFGWTHFDTALYSQNWNVSAGTDSHAVVTAVLICLWSFVGVESAAVSTGMVENPKRTVPLATMLGTGIAGVIYILSTQMISGMFPASEVAASGAPFALATTELFGSWTAPFVSAFTALACFTSLGSWMMLVGEAGKRAANDGNFPKIYGETDKNGVPKKGLILASIKMTALMVVLMFFSSKTAHASDLFNQLTTDAVLLTMLPYFYSSINLIRFEGMTTRNGFVMLFSGVACLFCFIALAKRSHPQLMCEAQELQRQQLLGCAEFHG